MKKFKTIVFLLVAGMLATGACNSPSQDGGGATSQAQEMTENADAAKQEDKTAIETLAVPRQDFGGYEFKVLRPTNHAGRGEDEVSPEEEIGDPINDAVYKRTKLAEEHLKVKVKSITSGETDDAKIMKHIKNSVAAGMMEFDAIVDCNFVQRRLLQEGMLANLYGVPNIDLGKPWWDQRQIENMSFENKKLYYISGDINYYDKYGIFLIYFNKKLLSESGIDYPYESVRQGKWTFDKFTELAKGFTKDTNGDGRLDEDDQWGVAIGASAVPEFLVGFGEKIISLDDGGIPYLRTTEMNHINAVEKLGAFFSDANSVLMAERKKQFNKIINGDAYNNILQRFKDGRVLMYTSSIAQIPALRDMNDDFGLLPYPKRDEAQKEYYHFTSWYWATSYSIPTTNDNLERTGAILETMAAYSVDTITPAVIDVSLKSKFARDEESAEMLALIFNAKSYEISYEYGIGGAYGIYCDVSINGAGNVVSKLEKSKDADQKALDKFIAAIAKLP